MDSSNPFTAEDLTTTHMNLSYAGDSSFETTGPSVGSSMQSSLSWTSSYGLNASTLQEAPCPVQNYYNPLADLMGHSPVERSLESAGHQSSELNSGRFADPCSRTTSTPTLGTPSIDATYSALFDLHTSSQGSSSSIRELVSIPRNIYSRFGETSRPTSQAWQDIRPYFLKLYITDDLPLHVVVGYLKRDLNFNATENMYKKRIKDWGISKNMSKHDKVALLLEPCRIFQQSISNRRRTLRYAKDSARVGRVDPKEVQVLVEGDTLVE